MNQLNNETLEVAESELMSVLRSAVQKDKVEVRILIDFGSEKIEFMLDELDAYDISEQQVVKTQNALALADKNGLTGSPLSDKEWEAYILEQKPAEQKKMREGKKPDRAEFFARKTVGIRVLLEVIAHTLKLSNGEKAFKTPDEERLFMRWLSTNGHAMKAVSDGYVELSKKVEEVRKLAKKSSSLVNGNSATPLPDATRDTNDQTT
jgi:hypothetical protein